MVSGMVMEIIATDKIIGNKKVQHLAALFYFNNILFAGFIVCRLAAFMQYSFFTIVLFVEVL